MFLRRDKSPMLQKLDLPTAVVPHTVPEVTCPHCWHVFPPEDLKYISTSAGLAFDHRVPDGAMRRFVPSQFTVQGDAIDPLGGVCTETACPNCHLKVPKLLALRDVFSVSLFGSPSSGKSYTLGSMLWMLDQHLGRYRLGIEDVDAEANAIIHDYQEALFNQPTQDSPVKLLKTEEAALGAIWYETVIFGTTRKSLPKPFLYRIDPLPGHFALEKARQRPQVLCIYDNAGETFEPGGEREDSPVTRHMSRAKGLLFVFDPTQEPSFRKACRERSTDPQWADERRSRQVTLFGEAMSRVLKFRGKLPTERVDTPLVVMLPKYDAWSFLLEPFLGGAAANGQLPSPYRNVQPKAGGDPVRVFNAPVIKKVSDACRRMLRQYAEPMLTRVEERCEPSRTLFIPVSATGCGPAGKDEEGKYYHRFGDIKPIWAEVPLLTLLNIYLPELVPTVRS